MKEPDLHACKRLRSAALLLLLHLCVSPSTSFPPNASVKAFASDTLILADSSLHPISLRKSVFMLVVTRVRSAHLDGVLPGPLAGRGLVAGAVGFVHVCDLRHQWVVRVRVCEHGANGEEDCNTLRQRLFTWCRSPQPLPDSDFYVPFEIVSAGLHWSLRISRQMLPLLLMLGW